MRRWFWELIEALREERKRLIFLDESGFNIDLDRRYGRAPKGQRVTARVPRNTPQNVSLIGALAPEGLLTAMEVDGAVDGECFTTFVEHCLVEHLGPNDVVVMDNVSTHSAERALALIEATGALVLYLPSYSPDYNPIEQCFSKMKTLIRGWAARTRRKLHRALAKAMAAITPDDARSWFEEIGYWVTSN